MSTNVSTFASVAAASLLGLLALTGIIVGTAIGVARPGQLDLAPGGGDGGAAPSDCGAFANLRSDVVIDCEAVSIAGVCDQQNRCVASETAAFADNANSFLGPAPVVCDSENDRAACADAGGSGFDCTCEPRLCVRQSNRAGGGQDLFTCDPLESNGPPPDPPAGLDCGRFNDVELEEQPVVVGCAARPFATFCSGVSGCSANGVLGDGNDLQLVFEATNVCGELSNDACVVDDQSCDCNETPVCVRNVRGRLQTIQCTFGRG